MGWGGYFGVTVIQTLSVLHRLRKLVYNGPNALRFDGQARARALFKSIPALESVWFDTRQTGAVYYRSSESISSITCRLDEEWKSWLCIPKRRRILSEAGSLTLST